MLKDDENYDKQLTVNIGDKVYVYHNKIFPFNIVKNTDIHEVIANLDEGMFGVVTDIKRWENTDLVYDYDCYKATIRLNNGKTVKIKDKYTHVLFRRYEFITLKDLKGLLLKNQKNIENSLDILLRQA
ncbi:hypothetical protein [Clostridium pasteurianum]|uniref:Uncharacterized protein n=1 Tax=Clostridium pasteurianum BC1 TaxID=86416 RepID=R4K6U7_CLOPA|nr:hypothetical protein [Clostridium pasteurianum]AGK97416.1 hypothetical protein Clopa_2556 [Clostridium pasteurianum BC1]